MKRSSSRWNFISLLFFALLIGCAQVSPELTWVTPGEDDNVAGTVVLRVEAVGETPPANVVFKVGDRPVAKVYVEEGAYSALWNSKEAQPGAVTLTATPYGGTAIRREIIVASNGSE